MHPAFLQVMMNDRVRQIERAAANAYLRRPQLLHRPSQDAIGLRLCRVQDEERLQQLAQLEGRRLPAGSFVIAEMAGAIVAALPLEGGAAFADPFCFTAHILPLLELRADQLRNAQRGPKLPQRALRRLASRG
jgi:hypothetical protein